MHPTIASIHSGPSRAVKLQVRQLAKLPGDAHQGPVHLQAQAQVQRPNRMLEVFLGLTLQIGPSIIKRRTRTKQQTWHQLLPVLITLTLGLCTSAPLQAHLQCPTGHQNRLAPALMRRSIS
jgi:hypothetical protein